MEQIEKAGRTTIEAAGLIITQVQSLINVFTGKIEDSKIAEITQKFVLARRVLSSDDLAGQIAPHFIRFKEQVERGTPEDIEYMINYDYTKLIEPTTAKDTRELIIALAEGIKSVWRNGDPAVNAKIKATTQRLVKLSSVFLDAEKIAKSTRL